MKIIDISMPIEKHMAVYPGNAKPKLAFVHKKNSSSLSVLTLGSHTGSHVDAPSHVKKRGKAIHQLPLENFYGRARVVDVSKITYGKAITEGHIARIALQKGDIVLFKTRNSSSKKFRKDAIYLSEEAAHYLIKKKVKAVGIDGLSIQKFHTGYCAAHCILLEKNIPVIEGLRLKGVKAAHYIFAGFPLSVVGAEGSPIRAVLIH